MKPRVILYNAVSLDAHIDGFMPDLNLYYSLVPQWGEQATLVGSDTMISAPDPIPPESEHEVNAPPAVPSPGDQRPILVVADSRGRVRNWHYWRKQPFWKDCLALCSEKTPQRQMRYLKQRNIAHWTVGKEKIDFGLTLERLNAELGIQTVRLESGGTLNGVLLRAGLVDEVHLLIHPTLVGDERMRSFFRDRDALGRQRSIRLKFRSVKKYPEDILLLSYEVVK